MRPWRAKSQPTLECIDMTKAAQTQPDKFKALAKELECDDSEAAFEKAVKRVAKAPPPKETKPAK